MSRSSDRALFHHQHSAGRQSDEAVCSAADDPLVELRVAHKPHDKKIEPPVLDQSDNRFGHVAGYKMGLDLHAGGARLSLCGGDDRGKTMVRLVLFLGDLIDAGRKARQFLDRHHMKLGRNLARQLDRRIESLRLPGEPSLAASILEYILLSFCSDRSCTGARSDERLEVWLKPALGDQSLHHRTADYRGQQDRVLALVDDVIGQTEERRDRPEGQACRHHQGRIHSPFALELEDARQRQNAGEFGDHLNG